MFAYLVLLVPARMICAASPVLCDEMGHVSNFWAFLEKHKGLKIFMKCSENSIAISCRDKYVMSH